ncbi:MAG: hypothetical protein AN484_11695 [Aphanizomenon flos-aquae WA102]|jgi:hypothetical protein|uniref:Uncharacterized protein n=1 Tax=Aphanizomenon flos-aquae WA102 TaxID=1710896 RepID=A0A1B7X2K1_APHFL|nr:MAG: hypothetical protein AN484_11695 [Aphanizomenon flos-aquae WA102]
MTIFINNNKTMKELAAKVFNYSGRKYKVVPQLNYCLNNYWDGGSKERCVLVNRENGEFHAPSDDTKNPFKVVAHKSFEIPKGYFIITHTISMGKDAGITFYVRPEEMPKDLASGDYDLTFEQKVVLSCFFSFKSSYAGIKDYRKSNGLALISSQEWDNAKASLIEAEYINARNAITTKGKNAALKFSFSSLHSEVKKQ